MPGSETKDLRLKAAAGRAGLFTVEIPAEEYDFFESLDMFKAGFKVQVHQQPLPLDTDDNE